MDRKIFFLTWTHRFFAIVAVALLVARHMMDMEDEMKSMLLYGALAFAVAAIVFAAVEKRMKKRGK